MLCVRVLGSCPYKFLSVLVLSVHSGMEQRGIIEACTSYNEIYTVYRYSLLYIMMLYMLFSQGGGVVIGMHIVCVFMSLCECVCVHECVGLCVGKPSINSHLSSPSTMKCFSVLDWALQGMPELGMPCYATYTKKTMFSKGSV